MTGHPIRAGDAVRVRGERWRVAHLTSYESCGVVECTGAGASNAGQAARFLLPFEAVDRLPRGQERPRLVRASTWRRAARGILAAAAPGWGSLRTAAGARVSLLPFQLEPALAMLRGLACRLLLADEVGLGKTIQTGLIVAELLARERDARVLIVTPAALREQWREELRDRFAIEAEIVDAAALARAAARLPDGVNPWSLPRVVITSIDFVKRPEVIRSLEPLVWDLAAFDEAHALAGRSDRATAAEVIAGRARRVVAVTATPHGGDAAAFERLRRLGALSQDDPLLTFRRSRAEAGIVRARTLRWVMVAPTREEARMHRALAAYAARVAREAPAGGAPAAALAMTVLGRRAGSSAASLARSIERRLALLGGAPVEELRQMPLPLDEHVLDEDEEPIESLAAPGLPDLATERHLLDTVLARARAVAGESKVAALRRLLRRAAEPAIVFTEYRDTLRHLAASLPPAAMLHGGLSHAERAREARRFTHGDATLLLATDAASEGLNLQRRCRLVVSLDVPWTPRRLEQRIGRVDRLGQRRRVHALAFVARGTREAAVASALGRRAAEAGDAAPFGEDPAGAAIRTEARLEAGRVATCRALRGGTGGARGDPPRAVLGVLGRGRGLLLAVGCECLDGSGAPVARPVVGLHVAAGPPMHRSPRSVRAWLDEVLHLSALAVTLAASTAHEAVVDDLRADLRAATARLAARERAMLERIEGTGGRLAAHLVQPGLFDGRAVRQAEVRRHALDDAAARARDRLHALQALCDLRAGDRRLLFAAAWPR